MELHQIFILSILTIVAVVPVQGDDLIDITCQKTFLSSRCQEFLRESDAAKECTSLRDLGAVSLYMVTSYTDTVINSYEINKNPAIAKKIAECRELYQGAKRFLDTAKVRYEQDKLVDSKADVSAVITYPSKCCQVIGMVLEFESVNLDADLIYTIPYVILEELVGK